MGCGGILMDFPDAQAMLKNTSTAMACNNINE